MKKMILWLLPMVTCISILLLVQDDPRDSYREFLVQHAFSQRDHLLPEQLKEIPKKDRPDLAWEQDFLATMDPSLGRPAQERLIPIYQQVAAYNRASAHQRTPGASGTPWVERGPTNVGGRTRTVMYDPYDPTNKKVWAGGVTGGLWYNNDITDPSSNWNSVNDFWANIAVSAIAYDPTRPGVMYIGTGEGFGAGSSRGAGVWKSLDSGKTWNQVSATSNFYYVNDLMVRIESGNGVLYVATRGNYYSGSWHGSAISGLHRSTNAGTSFSQVLPNIPGESFNYAAADIEIAANNRLWIGTQEASYGGTDRGGGRIMYSDDGTNWTVSYTSLNGRRVEIACAPSDANYVYGMIESSNVISEMVKTTNGGSSWSTMNEPNDADGGIPSTDFSRGQAWYDMIIAVHPSNANMVFTGAIDVFRSSNGGSTWDQIAHWYGGFGYPYLHADQHQMTFNPTNPNEMIFGNDGGVALTTDNTATNVVFTNLNRGYNVTQFYSCAIHPVASTDYFLAGTQDNGTQQFSTGGLNQTNEVTGGDGGFCFIDQTDPSYQITSYVYNSYWRSINGGASFQSPRMQSDQNTGRFINPTDYDDHQDVLFSAHRSNTINRIRQVSGSPIVDSIVISGMSDLASHVRVSPYTTTSSTIFVGTGSGDLFKVTNANGSPSTTNIGSGLPVGNISCVEIGASENELLVTFSNYGITSVWYSNNGGGTWVNKEGNLPDMPVRWALFNPLDRNEVILATEVGVWATSNIGLSTPNWTPSNGGLSNVRVDMLQIRDSDNEVIAATFGRGLFSSSGFQQQVAPTANFGANNQFPCQGDPVVLIDSSSGGVTGHVWDIQPTTFTYVSPSTSTSANPQVIFNAPGKYTVTLTVSNSVGSDSLTRTSFIQVGGADLPFSEDFETGFDGWTIENPDGSTTWAHASVSGNNPGGNAMNVDNYNYNAVGQRDGLVSPTLDFSNYSSVQLDFEYAYRRYGSGYEDSLSMFISTDCGATWNFLVMFNENGTGNWNTGTDLTTAFTPSSAGDWCGGANPACPSINLDAYAGNSNVKIKFENHCGWGNNLYIDNVQVTGVSSNVPTADFSASSTVLCAGDTVHFSDLSTKSPTSWAWTVTPSSGFSFVNGTSASSQNPSIAFTSSGVYSIQLTAANNDGSDTENKVDLIASNPPSVPTVVLSASKTGICSGETVSFITNTTHGGSSPAFVWKVNGNVVHTGGATYSSNSLVDGDQVEVEMTSSKSCVSPKTVQSNSVGITVSSPVTPSVSISASANSVCEGRLISFIATPINGGQNPSFDWKVNGNSVSTASSFSSSTLSDGDVVSVVLTSSEGCVTSQTATSNSVSMNLFPASTPSVTAQADKSSICQGTTVHFSANSVDAGTSPSYQWKVNGNPVGTNASSFSSNTLSDGDQVVVEVISSDTCVTSSSALSAPIGITVLSLGTPSVQATASQNGVCEGSSITFTTNPSRGGSSPGYAWMVNGNVVSTGLGTYTSSSLVNGDVVSVELTSSDSCVTSSTAVSNSITMNLSPNLTPAVSIQESVNSVCQGTLVNFVSTSVHPGSNPFYQWKLNGSNVGTNNPSYSNSGLVNGDVVTLEMTSSEACVTSATAISNSVTMVIHSIPAVSVSAAGSGNDFCNGDQTSITMNPMGGTLTGNGISGSTFYADSAGSGIHTILYTFTDGNGCENRDSIDVNVILLPIPIITESSGVLTCNQVGYQYQWFDVNGAISGANGQSYTPTANGVYYVEITEGDCSEPSPDFTVIGIHLESWEGVAQINLYPNPAQAEANLTIESLKNEEVKFRLTDLYGKVHLDQAGQIQIGQNRIEFDLSSLPSGYYILECWGQSGQHTLPLEIVR